MKFFRMKLLQTAFLAILLGLVLPGCSGTGNDSGSGNKINDKGGENMEAEAKEDVYEQARALGRGVNLGNALDAPFEGEWDMVIQEEYFGLIREKGFQSVRVPIRYSNKTQAEAPYTIDEAFMERVDWVVEQSLEEGLKVIVDLHHFDEMLSDPAGNKDRLLAIWDQVSHRYSDQPKQVYYEVLNEPNTAITPVLWNEYLIEAIAVIRSNDPGRTLIVGGGEWNSIDGLYKLELPEDDRNIIATFHYYSPILVTHQGAEWMTAEYGTTGLTWPGPPAEPVAPVTAAQEVDWVSGFFNDYNTKPAADNPAGMAALIRDLERAAQWGKDHDRPLFLGEFGVYSTADTVSRIAWTKAVRSEAERLDMSWSYWEFGASFGLYDRTAGLWREELVEALLPGGE
ncbi:glycoside hydrolase family 5 protein [Paenibacillus donghaensis]|uniref:Glycoside hydrolase family 5 domain-containing protein n=1 Tax=Paenibacillus donghaensis TaxID=414771 RepID=A0A2Z2KB04_9BACL|nr:glycoside hydrolase family 5 protein [Paenibacillus donghaensis]ASA20023.1 hypothetical protein B9T62_03945 [Paenibacillus donghaensis]